MWTYVFVPKGADPAKKHPLLLLPHGGVHGDFDTYHTHIVRELMAEGYVVVAPEYRGSTGYGREYREAIDYGGLEVDDVVAARDWAVATLEAVDPARVGIVGWSHGGLIALMAAFDHPDKFQAAYAGVPVSDLVARMGYQTDDYRALFSAPYHIGKTANEAVDEYRRRSPVTHVQKLQGAAARPHHHERPRRERGRGAEPDRRAEGGGQGVRVQGLRGRAGRPQLQPHGLPRWPASRAPRSTASSRRHLKK